METKYIRKGRSITTLNWKMEHTEDGMIKKSAHETVGFSSINKAKKESRKLQLENGFLGCGVLTVDRSK